jgi:hypothetical protein
VSLERSREQRDAANDDAAVCAYCGRPFVREEYLALHRGLEHGTEIDETEREAFETAHDEEYEDIRLFRLKVVLALVIIYFGFVMVYAVVAS